MKKAAEKAAEKEAKTQRASVMSRVSREMMRNRTAGEYATYNERLYAEGAQSAVARRSRSARAAEEKAREELEHATGAPKISRYANSLVRPEAAWDRLTEGYAEKFVALAKIKKDMEKKELGECTFRPKINGKSKTMMRSRVDALRDRGLSHHEQLYFDANRRQMRAEELTRVAARGNTFHPNAHKEGRFDERAPARSARRRCDTRKWCAAWRRARRAVTTKRRAWRRRRTRTWACRASGALRPSTATRRACRCTRCCTPTGTSTTTSASSSARATRTGCAKPRSPPSPAPRRRGWWAR